MTHQMGIIGFGWMAYQHYKATLPKIDGIEVTAVYDIDSERVDYAREQGIKPYYDLESFLADDEIDLVLVATPNDMHHDLAIAALEKGKNVLCEKPVALTASELEEMMAAAERSGKLLTVHHNRRWDKDFCTVRKAIEEGLIGTPYFIESRVQGSNGIPGDWRRVKEAGGGMLYDWGVHLIDQLLFMIDSPVTEVYAHILNTKYSVDDNFKVLLRFKNGISALVEVDTNCFQPLPRWHVSGDVGTMVVRNWACDGSIIQGTIKEIDWSLMSSVKSLAGTTRTMSPRPEDTIKEVALPTVSVDATEFYRNVVAALDGKAELLVKPEECLRVLKVIDAAFLSSEKGMCIKGEI